MMQPRVSKRIERYSKNNQRRRRWQRVVSVLTCVMVFCTTYALILPAITLSGEEACGLTEHTHSEQCYAQVETTQLVCTPVHTHSAACYNGDGNLLCADYVLHTHGTYCYDENGSLICSLPEIKEHTHTEECWTQVQVATDHVHEESCSTTQRGQLTCQLEETAGHTHSAECHALICVSEEEGHVHSESCYGEELTCGQSETEGHTHGDECYEAVTVLTCTQPTMETKSQLTCTRDEIAAHTHTDGCYTITQDANGSEVRTLTCTQLQVLEHVHTADCVGTVTVPGELLCTQEEHTHSLSCYADPSADLETADVWEQTMTEADLSGNTASDLVAIAKTQLGYKESEANYIVLEDGATLKGYTRYGQWNGTPYEDWNETFVQFCLHYAGIGEEDFPRASEGMTWRDTLAYAGLFADGDYMPQPGDLLFLTDYVGIIASVNDDGYITAIFGDYQNEVRMDTVTSADTGILGYGKLPELEDSTESALLTAEIEIDLVGNTVRAEETQVEAPVVRMSTWSLRAASNDVSTASTTIPEGQNLAESQFGTSVSIRYKDSSTNDAWKDLTGNLSNLVVGEDFVVEFNISYTVPNGTLSSEKNTLYYQLPINQLLEARSGNVRDNSGSVVGTYYIDTNGLVTITFLDYYVQQNAGGDTITGKLSFTSDIYSFDTDGDYKVKLEETDGNYIEVTLKQTVENDLTVEKTAGEANVDNGTVTYTIKVSSVSGTSGEVVLTDTMTRGEVSGNFNVVKKNGQSVSVTAPSDGAKNFTLTLPQMNAGEEYTITYTAKLTDLWDGRVDMTNAVTVKSKLGDDKTLEGSDEITVPFDYSLSSDDFKKSYIDNNSSDKDGTLSWTVTINADKIPGGIVGWTLSDTFNGEALNADVTIKNGGTTVYTGKLPYTFQSDLKGTITVTYTTSKDYGLGMNGAVNKAILTPPDDPDKPDYPTYQEEKNYLHPGEWWVNYNPLGKKFTSVTPSTDGTSGVLNWTLSIKNEKSGLSSGWEVTDVLTGKQYYTPDQETVIRNQIEAELKRLYGTLPNYTLEFTGGYAYPGVTYPNTGFTLTVNAPLEKGTTFTIAYSSTTAEYESTTQNYTNVASLNDKVWASDTYTHYPLLLKVDGNNNSHDGTSYDLSYLTTGLVSWRVYVSPTADMTDGGLIITEDIPDDPTLHQLQFNGNTFTFAEGATTATVSVSVNGTAYSVAAEQTTDNGNKVVKITIPKEVVAVYVGQRMTINVEMDVSGLLDNLDAADTSSTNDKAKQYEHKILNNSVTIRVDGENTDRGTDSQEQTIYKPDSTSDSTQTSDELIKKVTSGVVDGYVLPYTITINANAEDLDENSNYLEVVDTLQFTNWNITTRRYTTALDTSDVFITLYAKDGSVVQQKTALTAMEEDQTPVGLGGFVYTQTMEYKYGTQEFVTCTLKFAIPDGYKVVLEYQYAFYGDDTGNETLGVSNTSVLRKNETRYESATSGWYKVTDSDATADLRSINIYKVDAYNSAIHLAGAEYDLYKYNSEQGKYEYVESIQSNGASELEITTIVPNTAYFLVETKAPAGYILDESLHYFMVKDESLTTDGTVVYHAPTDFPNTAYYSSGGVIYITNERYTDKITVEKLWYDENGTLMTGDSIPKNTKIELKLYQVFSNYPVDFDYGTIGTDASLTLTVGEVSTNSTVANITTQTGDLQIGDTITVTYTFTEKITSNFPGMVHVTDSEYNQIPFTVSGDGLTYTFRYRITDASTTLRGWVGEGNVGKVSQVSGVSWFVDTPYESADHARSVSTYQIIELDGGENGWSHTFYGLPAYKLADNGQIQGYYSYYVNETSSSLAGYTPNYETAFSPSTSIQNGTIVIKNSPPETTSLNISKKWMTSGGLAPANSVSVDLYRIAQSTGQDQRYVDINYFIGTWSGSGDYLTKHQQVEAGSTVRLTMRLKNGYPSITSDASTIQLTETKGTTDDEGYTTYEYTFIATSDVNIRGHVGTSTREDAVVKVISGPTRETFEDKVYIENILINTATASTTTSDGVTITNNGNWNVSVTGLPTVGMTENGSPLYYSYYIKEDPLNGTSFELNGVNYEVTYQIGDDSVVYEESPVVTGGDLTVINTPIDNQLEFSVVKKWVDGSGNETDPTVDSITFNVYQIDKTDPDKKNFYGTNTLGKTNGWTSGIITVPKTDDYYYVVEEVGDYDVSYTYTHSSSDVDVTYITDGSTVTITNKVNAYVLPETGGTGTLMYTLGGLALCSWTSLQYINKKRRKEDNRS